MSSMFQVVTPGVSIFKEEESAEQATIRALQELMMFDADECLLALNSTIVPIGDVQPDKLHLAIQSRTLKAISVVWEWHNDGVLRVEAFCRKPDKDSAGVDKDERGFWFKAPGKYVFVSQKDERHRLPSHTNLVRFPVRLNNPCSSVSLLDLRNSYSHS